MEPIQGAEVMKIPDTGKIPDITKVREFPKIDGSWQIIVPPATGNTKFTLGQKVHVGPSIAGTVERIIWARGMAEAMYRIEWWADGMMYSEEFCESQVSP